MGDRLRRERTLDLVPLLFEGFGHGVHELTVISEGSHVEFIKEAKRQSASKGSRSGSPPDDLNSDFNSIAASLVKLSRRFETQREAVSSAIRELKRSSLA